MPYLEIRLWTKNADDNPIEGHSKPGWYMGVKHWDGELEVLAIEPIDVEEVCAIAQAVDMNGEVNSNLMPWVRRMNAKCLDSIGAASRSHDEAARKNLEAIVDLAQIQEAVNESEKPKARS